jgi:xylitol oxidase
VGNAVTGGGVDQRPTNWAGNIAFRAAQVRKPSSLEELQELVAGSQRVRALGSAHSFNRIADTSGALVSLAGLPEVIEVDSARSTVTVSASLRYSQLGRELHRRGFALRNLGSLPHITVAGSVATATHGSGDANGNLATAVSAVELVAADGSRHRLSRTDDGDRFNGAVVGLGTLGVVTTLTLDVQPAFDVRQRVYEGLELHELTGSFAEIFASAYSVSVFTTWRGDRAGQVWVKSRTDDPRQPGATFFGARPADGPRHPLAGMPAGNCTEQLGVPGPWYERLPHFRPDFTPSSGEELQAEYLVPRQHATEALHAINDLRDQVAAVLQVCEIRTVAADELWLSPAYHRDVVAVHFTWISDVAAVRPVLGLIEQHLAPLGAAPHWGKLFTTPPEAIRLLYPRLEDFQGLVRTYDPAGKFRNDFVSRYLLDAP